MNYTTAMVSAKNAPDRRRMIEEIRRELETMTEEQRLEYLLELRELFQGEQKRKLGVRVEF